MNLDPCHEPAAPVGSRFLHDSPSELAALPALNDALEAWCNANAVPVGTCHALLLVLDELFSNIVVHGFQHAAHGHITVQAQRDAQEVEIRLVDDAPHFDPVGYALPDVELPIDQRRIGGLGLMLARRTADRFEYQWVPAGPGEASHHNEVRFAKRFPPTTASPGPGA